MVDGNSLPVDNIEDEYDIIEIGDLATTTDSKPEEVPPKITINSVYISLHLHSLQTAFLLSLHFTKHCVAVVNIIYIY